MSDDFINDFRNSFGDDEGPNWVQDLADDDMNAAAAPARDADDFDQLRQQSARASSSYSDMTLEEDRSSGSGFSLNELLPSQRLILAVLVFLNVIVGAVALLAVIGILG